MELPKSYEPNEIEPKWQKKWEELGVNNFDRDDHETPVYSIDTPPPYPSGEFHIGNALNWMYFDFVTRYKRMRGFNVLFPQGWDCHGLPTEVAVEKKHNIRKHDVSPEKFRELCIELTEENIKHMREEMKSLGLSIDWTTEYRTMDPEYFGKTQLSFIQLYNKGLIYRGEHPVNWCPRCETAIADAEVEYENKHGQFNYIKFKVSGEDDHIIIATTRPELLPACVIVAVYPGDERYQKYVGKELEVPLFGQKVKLVEDSSVDPEFGTGVVMVCTYGDKADVRWVVQHKLPVIKCIDEQGKLTEVAGKYEGMASEEAKKAIIKDMKAVGLVEKQEPLQQNVGVCWRCGTPVEILVKDQWFLNVLSLKDEALKGAESVRWVPEHMKLRMLDWIRNMDWDWVISRQRLFATPIPAWYCSKCGEHIVASEDQIPVNPYKDTPSAGKCAKCGNTDFKPEKDVLDTWMDSSITIAMHAGWPDIDPRLFPADLQPNGTDIIRTWDYYLLVRHLALLGKVPYKTIMINGMVFGEDGRKMSKSLGNFVETTRARDLRGADALRQWAAIGGSTGSDIAYSEKDINFGYKFLRKLWNATRFAARHLEQVDPNVDQSKLKFRPTDNWILSRLNRLVRDVTQYMEDFKFNRALGEIHKFVWQEFCDMYIEEVKHRLYEEDDTSDAARFTLYQVLWTVTRLLAPFTPHFSEEIYQVQFAANAKKDSVHQTEWPEPVEDLISDEAEKLGELVNGVISAIRQFKSERDMALNVELPSVSVTAKREDVARLLEKASEDIMGTTKVKKLNIGTGDVGDTEVQGLDLRLSISAN